MTDYFATDASSLYTGGGRRNTLLIDGDIVAYRSAATCDGREYVVDKKSFKYKADAVAYTKKNKITDPIVLRYSPDPVTYAYQNVKLLMKSLRDKYPGFKSLVYLSDGSNFRYDLYSKYKENRRTMRTPTHLEACKEYLRKHHKAVINDDLEADDAIGITATTLQRAGVPFIIVSLDKDLRTIPGYHYDWVKDREIFVTPWEATSFFYQQCLMGDKTDNIPGLHGIGPKRAAKILANCEDEVDLYITTLKTWIKKKFPGYFDEESRKEFDPDEAKKRLLEIQEQLHISARLLYILHDDHVLWSPPKEVSLDAIQI